jgi:hypothetical protein
MDPAKGINRTLNEGVDLVLRGNIELRREDFDDGVHGFEFNAGRLEPISVYVAEGEPGAAFFGESVGCYAADSGGCAGY